MDIQESRTPHGTTLTLTRSLDRTNCVELDRSFAKLFDERPEAVWLDVAGLSAVDSAGLTLMLKWHRRALSQGRRFAIVGATRYHRKLLEITRLDRELVLFDAPGGRRLPAVVRTGVGRGAPSEPIVLT